MNFVTILTNVGSVVFWALIGVVLLVAAYHLIDRIEPVDFQAEIRRGNVAAAVVVGAMIIGIALIICVAMLPTPAPR